VTHCSDQTEEVADHATSNCHRPDRVHGVTVKAAPSGVYGRGVLKTRLDLDRIHAARRVIDLIFLSTPMYRCDALGRQLGCTVSIKLETANPVRSFNFWL
jgi:hypothetical protein